MSNIFLAISITCLVLYAILKIDERIDVEQL